MTPAASTQAEDVKIVRLDQAVISRSAIVVRPREPFVEWIFSISDDFPRDDEFRRDLEGHVRAYLVPEVEVGADYEWIVDSFWRDIFELELYAWSRDKHEWPRRRKRSMFNNWFDVTVVDLVIDLLPTDIEVDVW